MGTRGDNKLKSLLKSYEIHTPPPTFTNEVVREIEAMAEDKVYASAEMKSMLQRNVVSTPSTEFTYKILNKVREQPSTSYPPIISKKAWALIFAFLVVCVTFAFIGEPLGNTTSVLHHLPVGEFLSKLTLSFGEPLFYSVIVIVSSALLLALEYFISKRWRSRRSS